MKAKEYITLNLLDTDYKVVIETGESNIDANVILCIYGNSGTTKILPLRTTKNGTQAKFEENSYSEFHLKAIDVGKVRIA